MPDLGAQNAVVGDNYGLDLPETQVDERQLVNERKAAKFSRTKEFQVLKEHLENRITFYQSYLPDGRSVTEEPSAQNWLVANAVIGEFKAILMAYEQAQTAVDEADVPR